MTEDEMVAWHHQLNRYEFEQIPGDSEGQGSLACCNPWGRKELDMTKQLNNNNKNFLMNITYHCISKRNLTQCNLFCESRVPYSYNLMYATAYISNFKYEVEIFFSTYDMGLIMCEI